MSHRVVASLRMCLWPLHLLNAFVYSMTLLRLPALHAGVHWLSLLTNNGAVLLQLSM